MTANPDSALRQALVAAEKAIEPFVKGYARLHVSDYEADSRAVKAAEIWNSVAVCTVGDLRRAREAHALITEALTQHNGEKV